MNPVLQAAAGLVFALSGMGCEPTKSEAPAISMESGQELYDLYCATCHLDGSASFPTPALRDSGVLAGPPENTIQVILHGQTGQSKIDGVVTGGIMPAQAGLTNEEIAAIVSFVRSEFRGKTESVTPAQVDALRVK